jgi:hypothetical protein
MSKKIKIKAPPAPASIPVFPTRDNPAPSAVPPQIRLPNIELDIKKPSRFRGYPASESIFKIGQLYLTQKYGSRCIMPDPIIFEYIYQNDPSLPEVKVILPLHIGEQLNTCIKNHELTIFIGIDIYEEHLDPSKNDGHQNLLIYRPFKKIIERYEPHGYDFSYTSKMDAILAKLFENKLKLGVYTPVYKPAYFLVPSNGLGLQALQKKTSDPRESGYCQIWTLFMMESILMNPICNTIDVVNAVVEYVQENAQLALDLVRGYWNQLYSDEKTYYQRYIYRDASNVFIDDEEGANRKMKMRVADLDRYRTESPNPLVHADIPAVLDDQEIRDLRLFIRHMMDSDRKKIASIEDMSDKPEHLIHYFQQIGYTKQDVMDVYSVQDMSDFDFIGINPFQVISPEVSPSASTETAGSTGTWVEELPQWTEEKAQLFKEQMKKRLSELNLKNSEKESKPATSPGWVRVSSRLNLKTRSQPNWWTKEKAQLFKEQMKKRLLDLK